MAAYSIGDEVLNGWTIVRFIDEGGFGRVYEVQKTGHGIVASSALKVVSIPPSASMVKTALSEGQDEASVWAYFGSIVDDFAAEIAFTSSLAHPGIIGYQDHAILPHEDGKGWDILMRMELLTPLTDRMIQNPPSTAEVVNLGVQIADVLAFCHERDIIHRDVKPGNIFIDRMGRYKLGDFGVARTAEHTMGALSRKGTEDYMAPEMYYSKPYGTAVDVYALGVVLYQLLNGNRLPFLPPAPEPVGYHDRELAKSRRLSGEPLPLLEGCEPVLSAAIAAACSPDPASRPSAKELRHVLEGIEIVESNEAPAEAPAVQTPDTSTDSTPSIYSTVGVFGSSYTRQVVEESAGNVSNGDVSGGQDFSKTSRVMPPMAERELQTQERNGFEAQQSVYSSIPPTQGTSQPYGQTSVSPEAQERVNYIPQQNVYSSTPPTQGTSQPYYGQTQSSPSIYTPLPQQEEPKPPFGMAVAGMVLSLFGLFPIGLVFSIIALVKNSEQEKNGISSSKHGATKVMGMIGLILSIILIISLIMIFVL